MRITPYDTGATQHGACIIKLPAVKATHVTPQWCPFRTIKASSLAGDHRRRVTSADPDAISRPVGLKAMLVTPLAWPQKVRSFSPNAAKPVC